MTLINQIDLETIQQKATTSFLAALGFNQSIQREVVFCSIRYQGLGLKHLYNLQGNNSKHQWTVYVSHAKDQQHRIFLRKPIDKVEKLPNGATTIDIKHQQEEYIVTGNSAKEVERIKPSPPHKLARKIKQRKADVLFFDATLIEIKKRIRTLLSKPALIDTATDGSHKPKTAKMTYGWVVAINKQRIIAKGQGPAKHILTCQNHSELKHMG